ncbi:hypothetical protein CLV71_124122 [Actinophytocola oryzae]|uniref:HTH cro/C1-type domain-containing protein n=2 Tax=Actinophytocola oryzae TaxID=502181 RepID=A0A4R7UTW4_9PSEU|nr:hypothetical protein CLV71_124122 [Actinophytocola oryzae]
MGKARGKTTGIQVPHAEALPGWIGAAGTDDSVISIGAAVGEVVRRRRTERGVTQAELARMLSTLGDRWTKGRVFALESGERESATLAELVQLAIVLVVPIHELIKGAGDVRFSERAFIPRDGLAGALARGQVPDWNLDDPARADPVAAEIADRLGLDATDREIVRTVIQAAQSLYGQTATEERRDRVGDVGDPGSTGAASRQRNFTQQLEQELREALGR